jgi:hypothetical protein
MKATALANRLVRSLKVKSLQELTADGWQEIQDAVNAALQSMHAVAPPHSKITVASMVLPAPVTISIGVTNGSNEITGHTFAVSDFFKTIRLAGESIDNQVIGESSLLHPWTGTTGTVSAVLYGDAVAIPDAYEEIISDPLVLETNNDLTQGRPTSYWSSQRRKIGTPEFWWIEENARNANPAGGPAVLRIDTLPPKILRLQMSASLAPARISFMDFMDASKVIPIRDEHIEAYLIPVALGNLTTSDLWRDKETAAKVASKAETAEAKYAALVPQTLGTPNNHVRTRPGF